jgi:hypothetical protein
MNITEDYKKEVYADLANAMISGLENGEVLNEDAQKSATFILERLDGISKYEELVIFLEELANTWAVYKPTSEKVKAQKATQKDEEQMEEIQNKLKNLINPTL